MFVIICVIILLLEIGDGLCPPPVAASPCPGDEDS